MTDFWYRWLLAWCAGIGVFGLVLAGAGFDATDGLILFLLGLFNPNPYEMSDQLRFALGLQGALSMALAVLYWGAIRAAVRHKLDAQLWRAMLAALLVWYLVDNIVSLATGFAPNLLSNTLIVALFLLPLLKTGVLRG